MYYRNSSLIFVLIVLSGLQLYIGYGQQVENVPEAFASLSSNPETIWINNELEVPAREGHFQGVQVVKINRAKKMFISGSSLDTAYILKIDLNTKKTEKLIPLMVSPYRHAGGIQISSPYLIVGIEDNATKTISKVCLYNYSKANLNNARPNLVIDRQGKARRQTAGAVGLMPFYKNYLAVVGNWDSRNWDFYTIHPQKNEYRLLESFTVPDDWPSYQSINLIMDNYALYAIGFYAEENVGRADLILVSKQGSFETIMKKLGAKTFNCNNQVDFSTAAGLQIDKDGGLHVWATQRGAAKKIAVNRFSSK